MKQSVAAMISDRGSAWLLDLLTAFCVTEIADLPAGVMDCLGSGKVCSVCGSMGAMAHDPFYWSPKWREFRKRMLETRRMCEMFECTKPAKHVDHKRSRRKGGAAFDPANIQVLCHSHHSEKTARHDGGFGHAPVFGCDIGGRPLDPTHPWNARSVPASKSRHA